MAALLSGRAPGAQLAGHAHEPGQRPRAHLVHDPRALDLDRIVLDIRMPAMTGFELQGAIAGTPRALPVLAIEKAFETRH